MTGEGPAPLVQVGGHSHLPTENIVQIGIRDVDRSEAERVKQSGLTLFTMREIDEQGMASVAVQALTHLEQCNRIHVSLDLDALDPVHAPGVGTPVKGGLSYREAHLLTEMLGECSKVHSLDVVEVNPILDEKNATAELAVELIASILGKKIL
ncbi:MAG: arginase family protein [Chloroflexota bacterium]